MRQEATHPSAAGGITSREGLDVKERKFYIFLRKNNAKYARPVC